MHGLSLAQRAYLAGFIDGEGCVSITKKKDHKGMRFGYCFRPMIVVGNTNQACLETLRRWTGLGRVSFAKRGNRPKNKDGWQWIIWSRQAEQLLRSVSALLLIKTPQTKIVLSFISNSRSSPGRRGLSATEWKRQHRCYEAIKRLNKRGKTECPR